MSYIKGSFMSDNIANMFDTIDGESDIEKRMYSLSKISERVSARLSDSLKKACYQAKVQGIPTDLISLKLGISRRAVLRFIRMYSVENNVFNPLDVLSLEHTFDIRKNI